MRLQTKKQIEGTKDQHWLTEARVITGEEIENLNAAGGVVGINKSRKQSRAKASQKYKGKAKAIPTQRTVHFISDSDSEEWFEIHSGT